VVVAESAIPTVQALIRWDPVGHADAELDSRAEVGLPPAVHLAAVDGAPAAVDALLATADLADTAQLLGPVDLPAGVRRPPGASADSPVSRMLVRVPRDGGLALAAALRRAAAVLSARHDQEPVRVQIDPLHIG
jgi:primosomal protein N' (replication factor Y) (superfamily II helicase)